MILMRTCVCIERRFKKEERGKRERCCRYGGSGGIYDFTKFLGSEGRAKLSV